MRGMAQIRNSWSLRPPGEGCHTPCWNRSPWSLQGGRCKGPAPFLIDGAGDSGPKGQGQVRTRSQGPSKGVNSAPQLALLRTVSWRGGHSLQGPGLGVTMTMDHEGQADRAPWAFEGAQDMFLEESKAASHGGGNHVYEIIKDPSPVTVTLNMDRALRMDEAPYVPFPAQPPGGPPESTAFSPPLYRRNGRLARLTQLPEGQDLHPSSWTLGRAHHSVRTASQSRALALAEVQWR